MKQKNEDRPALSLLLDLAMEFGRYNEYTRTELIKQYQLTKPTLKKISDGKGNFQHQTKVYYTKCLLDYVDKRRDELLRECNTAAVHEIDKRGRELFARYLEEE